MLEIALVVSVVLICIFLLMRRGNLKFWKIVNLDTDEFYNYIIDNEAWRLSDEYKDLELDGPYRLYVPSLGKRIKVYGVVGLFENSQKEYIEHFKKLKN